MIDIPVQNTFRSNKYAHIFLPICRQEKAFKNHLNSITKLKIYNEQRHYEDTIPGYLCNTKKKRIAIPIMKKTSGYHRYTIMIP